MGVISDNYLYWFFSTLSQVLAALIAVVGMFSVYKLERIQFSCDRHFENLRKWLETWGENLEIDDKNTPLEKAVVTYEKFKLSWKKE